MPLSRRQFFDRLREVAEGPHRWREKRIAELRDHALAHAPADWTPEQRNEAAGAVERKLIYLSDDSLRAPGAKHYVESIIRSKDIFFKAKPEEPSEHDYYQSDDPYNPDYDYSG
jgi:hypothetical protein